MRGVLRGDRVIMGGDAVKELYDSLHYGRLKDDSLEIALVEAAYLLDRGKIEVEEEGAPLSFRDFFAAASRRQEYFELKYIVYRDLRERGYYVQPGVTDFRVYPRGGKPGAIASHLFVHVASERKPLPLAQVLSNLQAAVNVRRQMVLAIVDEEGDITYYGVRYHAMRGDMGPLGVEMVDGSATLMADRVIIWDEGLSRRLHERGFYGNMLDERRLQLSLIEAAYLMKAYGLEVRDAENGAAIGLDSFIQKTRIIDGGFEGKLRVYADLRDRGLVAKTGFKFGSHFRAYLKIEAADRIPHSVYLVDHVGEGHVFILPDLSRSVRLANSVRKEMVFAFGKEGVQYLGFGRIKL